MFVKIATGLVINTDHIYTIEILNSEDAVIMPARRGLPQLDIKAAAASVLMELLEVSQAFDFNPDPKVYKQTLTSQLATILRDTQPGGATVLQLSALVDSDEESTMQALLELRREGVTVIALNSNPVLWFHVTNAPGCDANEICRLRLGHIGPHATYDEIKCDYVYPAHGVLHPCTALASDPHTDGHTLSACDECVVASFTPSRDLSGADVVPVLSPAADSES